MHKLLTAILASLILAACGSQPPAPEQTAAKVEDRTPEPIKIETPPVKQVVTEKVAEYSLDSLRDPKSILSKRSVFFDYDQYVIKDEFKALLEAHGRYLVGHGKVKMLIQGNTDERGSREYNIALGQRRADSVRQMMVLLGAKEQQIETVSFGEEKPRAEGHDEAAWAQNRRGDIVYAGE
jgi:peptidoglycan-associated lipoprotein